MAALFIYGTLRHRPLLHALVGRRPATQPASLHGYAAHLLKGRSFPGIFAASGGVVEGDLLTDLTGPELAVLDDYEYEPHHQFRPVAVSVETGGGSSAAAVYMPEGSAEPGDPWDVAAWTGTHGEATVLAAGEYIAGIDPIAGSQPRGQLDQMLVRAHSFQRARNASARPALRRGKAWDSIDLLRTTRPYSGYFSVAEHELRFPRFDGMASAPVRRTAFMAGDAATVLPYDPVRDRVMVIEQFRVGPFARGDALPWVLEPVAGRVDPGESPEQAAIRELREEAGIEAGRLLPVASYYPSPGAISEYLYSYVALCDLPDESGEIGGLDAEDEDILSHVMSFDDAMALIANGEADCAPLLVSLFWLQANRARLRAAG